MLTEKNTGPGRDLTQGSLIGNLWHLSWPMIIIYVINTLGPTVDMIWVGTLGPAAIAGVGISGLAISVVSSLMFGLFTGTTALVARFMGALDESNARLAAQQAFVIGVVFSALMAVVGIFLSEQILVWLNAPLDVIAQGAVYLRIQLIGTITAGAVSVTQSIMQASGDSVTPLKISVLYRVLQIVLCPLLVFGWWLFPRLEVSGAALSNIIAQTVGGTISLLILFRGGTRLAVTLKDFRFDAGIIWRTIKIGIPASITFTERSAADMVLVTFIIPFGTIAVAAHSLANRIDMLIQMLSAGLGLGAGVLAGQNLGAGKPERAARTAWLAVLLSTGTMWVCAALVWFWVEHALFIFNTEPELVGVAATFLRIQIAGYMVWGIVISLSMVFNGVGDTTVPMWSNLATMWGVQMVLSYYLPRFTNLGVYGVRWAIVSGILVRAIIYPLYLKFGPWQKKKI